MLKTSQEEGRVTLVFTRSALGAWVLLILSFIPSNSYAQDSTGNDLPVLDMRTKAEFLDQEERISGGSAVGVVFYEPTDSVQLDAAYVYISEPITAGLEMHLATVDGRYLATFDYVPSSPISGWVRLNLSLSKPGFLDKYELSEVALLMTNSDTGVAYPVRWGEQSQGGFVRVYVNTEGAKSYFASYDEEKKRWTARNCTTASQRSSFKFDRICDVPISDVDDNSQIEIIRKRGAGFGTPIRITVSLPRP